MTTATGSVWRGAWKNAISTFCGIILANILDPQTAVLTWQWFRHIGIASIMPIIFNEARYWQTWADRPDDNHPVVLSFFIAFFFSIVAQLVFRWTA